MLYINKIQIKLPTKTKKQYPQKSKEEYNPESTNNTS